jgi:hypothetical protein
MTKSLTPYQKEELSKMIEKWEERDGDMGHEESLSNVQESVDSHDQEFTEDDADLSPEIDGDGSLQGVPQPDETALKEPQSPIPPEEPEKKTDVKNGKEPEESSGQ